MAVPFELIVFAFGLIMIFLGSIIEKMRIVKNMGAILLIVLTVVLLSDGISTVDNLSTMALASVSFAVGFVTLLTDNFSKEEKEEKEIEEDGRYHD